MSSHHFSLGSRIWKAGFSGETEPRAVFWAQEERDEHGEEIWDLDMANLKGVGGDRKEGRRLVGVRIVKKLREVFHKYVPLNLVGLDSLT